jgi:2-iminobutanoate/2-iminopropanoate deaminase
MEETMPTVSQNRRYMNLPSRKSPLPFSDAVLEGNTLYIAGRIGIDPDTGMVPAQVDDELKILFAEFQSVLDLAEMTFDDLVWVQVFSPDLSLWQQFNQEYLKHFSKDHLPARAFLGSAPLLLGGRFEMMGIAVK